jgi:hypothetical protein
MSTAEWVRGVLAMARRREPRLGVEKQSAAVRAAVRHKFPSADIETRLAEVESRCLAVLEQHAIAQILRSDSGFDGFPGIRQLS